MLSRILAALSLAALLGQPVSSAEIIATTKEGKTVVLYDNGTWKYLEEANKPAPVGGQGKYARAASATEKLDLLRGKASVYYDPAKWKNLKESEPGRFELTHKDGDGYAIVIAERMQVPLESLRNIALAHAKEAAPDARLVAEEKREVNGSEVLFMQTAGTIQGMSFVYVGYFYTGKAGSVQIITYTGENLLEEYQKDFEELLNGFQVQPR